MKRLFLLLALVGMIATSCEDSGIEEPSNPTEQPDDNTDEEQPGDDENKDEEQPGGDDNTDEEQPGGDENEDDGELPVFEIDGPGKYTIGAEGGSIEVVVTTNLEYRLEVSEDAQSWLTIADTRAVRTERLTISVSPNNTDSERTATISVFDVDNNKVFSFTLTQEYVNPDEIIKFVDNTAKTICLVNWDTNGDAELSIGEAVAVTDIGSKFRGKDIMSFDEFKYFTGVTTIVTGAFKDCANLVKISIPDSVTTIGDEAFCGCSSLTSITIPDSVTSISSSAFEGCDSLTEFNGKFASEDGRCLIVDGVLNSFAPYGLSEYTIPDSVTTIGDGAFSSWRSLTSITIPDSVTTIGDYAFQGCDSLTSITIPDSVTTIGDYAFQGCDSLTSITIPDSVTTIGYGAFEGCDSLTSITIPDSVTTIGYGAFEGCDSLTEFKGSGVSSDGLCIINNKGVLLYFLGRALTEYIIPDSVTSIGERAFSGCRSLTSVTIPDSVTTIGDYAFYYCDSLTSVTIPDSVTTIGDSAFYYCNSLTSVTIGDSVTSISSSAFSSCGITKFKGSGASSDGLCIINNKGVLLYFLDRAQKYIIPDSVTTIGDGAFSHCSSLTSITIPDSVTTIGDYAFAFCSSLTSITIPDSVTSIGDEVFYRCDSLTSVTIGDSVTKIGEDAFYKCSSLTSVYCKATTPPSLDGSRVFGDNHSGRKFYVPTGSVNAYKSASYWSKYADDIVGYDFENGVVVE